MPPPDDKKFDKAQFSSAMIQALDDLERIEFDVTIRVVEGIHCKGTIFVKRNPIEDDE